MSNNTRKIEIVPCPAPRQNRSDKWKKRPEVVRYRAFRDELRLLTLDKQHKDLIDAIENKTLSGIDLEFHIPFSKSWSKKKKMVHNYKLHRQKPDVDNLIKAFLDALMVEDCTIAIVRGEKRWMPEGAIYYEILREGD